MLYHYNIYSSAMLPVASKTYGNIFILYGTTEEDEPITQDEDLKKE